MAQASLDIFLLQFKEGEQEEDDIVVERRSLFQIGMHAVQD